MFRQAARLRPLISRSHSLCNGKNRPELTVAQFSSRAKVQAPSQLLKRPNIVLNASNRHAFPRFASTSSAVASSSNIPDASVTLPDPLGGNAWDPNFHDIVASDHVTTITPHIGYLKELGIDFGWGSSSMVQWLMEHIHVYGELPWFGTLMLTALSIRVLLLPFIIRGADNTGKMSAVQPLLEPIHKQLKEARMKGDQQEMMQYMKQSTEIRRRAGVSLTATTTPILLQLPLVFGAFRLTRKMVEISVPGLETGGILWFTDLTYASAWDPQNWILPAMTSVVTHYTLRRGGELGAVTPEQQQMMSFMKWIFPGLGFVFTSFLPAAITLQFFTASCLALIQTYALSSNRIRDMLGIHPLVKRQPVASVAYTGTITKSAIDTTMNQSKKPGVYAGMKKQAEEWVASRTKNNGKRLSQTEKAKADSYEKRRRQELEDELHYRRQRLSNKRSQMDDKDE